MNNLGKWLSNAIKGCNRAYYINKNNVVQKERIDAVLETENGIEFRFYPSGDVVPVDKCFPTKEEMMEYIVRTEPPKDRVVKAYCKSCKNNFEIKDKEHDTVPSHCPYCGTQPVTIEKEEDVPTVRPNLAMWLDINKYKPKENRIVYITFIGYNDKLPYVGKAKYINGKFFWYKPEGEYHNTLVDVPVTHWMPEVKFCDYSNKKLWMPVQLEVTNKNIDRIALDWLIPYDTVLYFLVETSTGEVVCETGIKRLTADKTSTTIVWTDNCPEPDWVDNDYKILFWSLPPVPADPKNCLA